MKNARHFHTSIMLARNLALSAGILLTVSCKPAGAPGSRNDASNVRDNGRISPIAFDAREIGRRSTGAGAPWITDLTIADLDRDGLLDIVACDARANRIVWLRQASAEFVETAIGPAISGPAHVEVVDVDADGDQDVLVAAMGIVPPSTERTGSVVVLENHGDQTFTPRTVLAQTHRVTDVRSSDMNGDGRPDLIIAQFGYFEGQVQWLENRGDWKFAARPLLDLAGAIHAPVLDFNRDTKPDIVALISQDWEEVWGFENRGNGDFSTRVLHGSTNRDYGSSGLTVADLNRDGNADLIYTNGDGFDYATPGSRPWHGLQWLEGDGRGNFRYHRVGDFAGAYGPCVADLDRDGDNDVVAVSAFNDWSKPESPSLVWFENLGEERFTPHVLATQPTHQVVAKAADLDGDGTLEIVTGGFAFFPPTDRAARISVWKRRAAK